MNYKRMRELIKKDISVNKHPKNRFFIYCIRLGQWGYSNKKNIFFALFIRILLKIRINQINQYPLGTKIGGGIRLPHNIGIVISDKAIIGENCTIFQQVTIGVDDSKNTGAPTIGNNVYIGAGAKIIGDITIGDNVKIGANAVVTKDIPCNSTVVNCNCIVK